MKRIISILFMLAAFAPHTAQVFSADYDSLPDDAALDAELEWIRAETVVMTKIATKTAMDADLVPGMVTVLRGGALEEQGIRTVHDALSLVPGVSTHINVMGNEIVSVRGLGGSLFSGNLKLMLDGVALNDSLTAGGYVIYQLPVEQIERIEIIRGPGSVIYGEYAYAGVVNVITRKKKNRAYARLDGDESVRTCSGGGTLSYEHPEREFDLTLNISGLRSRGSDVTAGEDRLYEGFSGMTFGDFSYSPGACKLCTAGQTGCPVPGIREFFFVRTVCSEQQWRSFRNAPYPPLG
ncbi:MAG: hypothetical protein B6245_11935 [Desulfobacteraceae bacterium 4572_88]|nr:MAG: hypothetical protein B6245_11935 [Desulfobacteraceae bacterium 4572_88]